MTSIESCIMTDLTLKRRDLLWPHSVYKRFSWNEYCNVCYCILYSSWDHVYTLFSGNSWPFTHWSPDRQSVICPLRSVGPKFRTEILPLELLKILTSRCIWHSRNGQKFYNLWMVNRKSWNKTFFQHNVIGKVVILQASCLHWTYLWTVDIGELERYLYGRFYKIWHFACERFLCVSTSYV